MMINELLSDEKFLDLLDKDNSEDLLKYISNLRFKKELTQNNLCEIGKMFKELGIYSDICLDKANFAENKKYIGPGVFNRIKNQCLDLRNKVLASASVVIPSECVLIIDNTTKVLINDFFESCCIVYRSKHRKYNYSWINPTRKFICIWLSIFKSKC